MATGDATARDPRRQRTIEALLAAAEPLFTDRGLEEVTVEEIAERAGVAVGSIYNSFGSKAGLHAAVVDRALDVDREYMNRAYVPELSPIEQLEAAARQYLRFALERPQYFRMLAFPAPLGNYAAAAETAARLAHRVDEQNARMTDAIERGIAEGTLRPVDARRTATVLWASWNGVISLAWRPDELREDADDLADLLSLAANLLSWGLRRA
jgi:TetR/AcrR family transcriptional regulator